MLHERIAFVKTVRTDILCLFTAEINIDLQVTSHKTNTRSIAFTTS
jgi:hypothetical protein